MFRSCVLDGSDSGGGCCRVTLRNVINTDDNLCRLIHKLRVTCCVVCSGDDNRGGSGTVSGSGKVDDIRFTIDELNGWPTGGSLKIQKAQKSHLRIRMCLRNGIELGLREFEIFH